MFLNSNIVISEDDGQEYEVDEIAQLFKRFCEDITVNVSIGDDNIVNAIQHFFPNVVISGEKYITSIVCKLWTRQKTSTYIVKFRNDCQIKDETKSQSFNTVYKYYCKELPTNSLVVSKSFFEARLLSITKEHVVNAKCIKSTWWTN